MNMLVFYFGDGGESLVKDVYMNSALAVGKWMKRDSVINSTISNVFHRVPERYTPPHVRHQNGKRKNKITEEKLI